MKAQVVALVDNAEGLPAKSVERALGKYGRAYAVETLATDAGKLAEALADAEIALTHSRCFDKY
ncbi:MAG TPA: hypothetical protein VLB27_00980, partial [candidate division Zixibacteria bacterium]|nr:hypothetical protein [candidate division Zixibacteria bacterium]